jgi:hypothetical protein
MRTFHCRSAAIAGGLIVLAACGPDEVEPPPEQVRPPAVALVGVPVMPGLRPVSVAGTNEAVGTNLLSDASPDSVVGWYRRELLRGGWRLISDLKSGDTLTLHAQRDGPPLWIIAVPGRDGTGSAVQVMGAVGK